MDQHVLLNPRRDGNGGNANAEPGVVEPVCRQQAVWVWHAVLWRAYMVKEAAVLVVSNDEQRRVPFRTVTNRFVPDENANKTSINVERTSV